jgi:hypothetical protein
MSSPSSCHYWNHCRMYHMDQNYGSLYGKWDGLNIRVVIDLWNFIRTTNLWPMNYELSNYGATYEATIVDSLLPVARLFIAVRRLKKSSSILLLLSNDQVHKTIQSITHGTATIEADIHKLNSRWTAIKDLFRTLCNLPNDTASIPTPQPTDPQTTSNPSNEPVTGSIGTSQPTPVSQASAQHTTISHFSPSTYRSIVGTQQPEQKLWTHTYTAVLVLPQPTHVVHVGFEIVSWYYFF